ncbi:uncharacterized protein LOC122757677 [Drosophila mojavensis]|uniref:uncharacterized protein LOC122757677 n=1 Tax=Drosophila mojavensis TaxID=7230 RepID=UPI001CD1209C|nr:uncharacterized protein LOC122757677 [Drosophila mojavensis]
MPYENDTSMQKLPLVAMLFELLPPRLRRRPKLVNSLTEMGLCRTSSQRANFGFPFDKQLNQNYTDPIRICNYFHDCNMFVKAVLPDLRMKLFIHDVNEFLMPHDRRTLSIELGDKDIQGFRVMLNSLSAEDSVRNVPVAYRRCRYTDENNLKYYSVGARAT